MHHKALHDNAVYPYKSINNYSNMEFSVSETRLGYLVVAVHDPSQSLIESILIYPVQMCLVYGCVGAIS